MSSEVEMVPIGDRVFRKSFGLFLWRGVSTTPGATVLKRMCSFEYSEARLRVIASRPPFVIIGRDTRKLSLAKMRSGGEMGLIHRLGVALAVAFDSDRLFGER